MMISQTAFMSGLTIARSMWSANRAGFLALFAGPLACGWGVHFVPISFQHSEGADVLAYLPMGLCIFLTFVLCNFTESDRKGRFDGFPVRLFTLPASTRTLLLAPILFSVSAVAIVYAVWAILALPALGRDLPIGWPLLYLANGMICFQAIVWSLARFRLIRMLILGVGGTFLALGWLGLRKGAER